MSKILETQNIGIKIILGFIGLVMVIAGVYAKVMKGFLLTDIEASIDWWFVAGGFVLAVGSYKYNTIVDGLTAKFFPSKSKIDGKNDAH